MKRNVQSQPFIFLKLTRARTGLITVSVMLLITSLSHAQSDSKPYQYLPSELTVRATTIQSPREFLGYEMGERHTRHHELVEYFKYLAEQSARVTLETYGTTHGNRPLVAATITSVSNHANLDQIIEDHRKLVDARTAPGVDIANSPAVIYLGYSVHGDESSGGNAAPIIGHLLATSEREEIQELLEDVIVIVDPCLNPDGFDRFAAWANSRRGLVPNGDPVHAEHHQPFPGGRVNYYWFDLNRDWLPLQHPESQGRATILRKFRPNVVADFHEMSTNSTFFFQPGVPQRKNPLTPNRNVELTKALGDFHARALDEIGSIYFTEEIFDDFYVGKGSTYPDLHGAVGVLFEQASSRGHVQESVNGRLEFPFTIRNQVRASISSLRGTKVLREELLDYQRNFYARAQLQAQDDKIRFHVFRAQSDAARIAEFARILEAHDIRTFRVSTPMRIGQNQIDPLESLVVPSRQAEYLFLQSLLERRTNFEENIFYDVSTWVLPLAFNLEHAEVEMAIENLVPYSEVVTRSHEESSSLPGFEDVFAYVIDWRDQRSGQLLFELLDAGAITKVAKRSFAVEPVDVADREYRTQFEAGSILIPIGIQGQEERAIIHKIASRGAAAGVEITPVQSGLTPQGIDLGSGQFGLVKKPQVMMFAGAGVERYSAGTLWHLIDTQLKMPLTHVEPKRLTDSGVKLSRYSTIMMPSGSYSEISDTGVEKLKHWLAQGGCLIAIGSSIEWLEQKELIADDVIRRKTNDGVDSRNGSVEETSDSLQKSFANARHDMALEQIGGAIFEAKIDRTHPCCFGYTTATLPVFRNSTLMLNPSKNRYSNPVLYTPAPLLSGYVSTENLDQLKNTVSVTTVDIGLGNVILMVDEPNFRAFWWGTSRLLTNSIFFGSMMKTVDPDSDGHNHGHGHDH